MDFSLGPSEPPQTVPYWHTLDPRYGRYIRKWQGSYWWKRTAIKDAMRELWAEMQAASPEECIVMMSHDTYRIILDACQHDLPNWYESFREEFMAKSPVPDFQIQPAVRGIRNIIIALAGEAGDGKTCSALRLARGLSRTGSILLIDTEQGRSTQYAPLEQGESGDLIFDFSILHLEPPFSPLHYRAAVAAAARYQPEVLIIDSISHEHVGVGGILDIADKAPDNKHGRAFKEPRAQHRQFMGRLTQHPWFVILTMRASEVLPENKGDPTIWKLQCDKTLRNDCTAILPLSQGRVRPWFEQPWKQPSHLRSIFVPGRPVDEEMGSQLARWCQPQGNWNDPQETEDERPAN